MKRIIALTIICIVTLLGCGKKNTEPAPAPATDISVSVVEEVTENSVNIENSIDEELAESNLDDPWRNAYLDYLNSDTNVPNSSETQYTLIYLDNDDIPELFIDTGVEAGGQTIISFYDGKVIEQHFSRLGSQYIEKTGLVYTNTGHMDYYPLTITKLENGVFTEIGSGVSYVSSEDWEKMLEDENYPYTLTFEWEGDKVSEAQFNANVAELYNLEQSKYPDNFYTYDEVIHVIESGK